MDRKRTNSND